MREILFKAKAINRDKGYHRSNYKNGDWVYGLVTRLYDERFENLPAEMTELNGVSGIEIDHNTICQYTGLTDKNGNKIWENDVVCTPYVDPIFGDMVNDEILDDYTWKVVFVDGGFCVENEDKIINLRSFTNGNHIKAIGNIFDNACIDELLEDKE